MRASSTTVAYCPELTESSTHRANKISVAWNHYLAHASIWINRFAGCILPNMKTIGLLLIVAVVALGGALGKWRKLPMKSSRSPGVSGAARKRARSTPLGITVLDRKSTRLNSSHLGISYAVFCLKKK